MRSSLQLCAILPLLKDYVGHVYAYNVSVEQASHANGWAFEAHVPKNCQISSLPSHWKKTLAVSDWENQGFFQKLIRPFYNLSFFLKLLKEKKAADQHTIFFFESFGIAHLAVFALAILFTPLKKEKGIGVAIVHRYSPEELGWKAKAYKIVQKLLQKKLPSSLFSFTDTEILQEKLSAYFQASLTVLPIPHTQSFPFTQKQSLPQVKCWWPGGSIREDKGLKNIQHFTHQIAKDPRFHFRIAENARNLICESAQIHFVERNLHREQYQRLMSFSDLILLPYPPEFCHSRSSGIFVEAVCAGGIPVVQDHTWMAYELKKYDLSELCIDWKRKDLLDFLFHLKASPLVAKKLEQMKKKYGEFHSPEKFSHLLKISFFDSVEQSF